MSLYKSCRVCKYYLFHFVRMCIFSKKPEKKDKSDYLLKSALGDSLFLSEKFVWRKRNKIKENK